jgi:hypothetical protein
MATGKQGFIDRLEARRLLAAVTINGSSSADEIRMSMGNNTIFVEVNGFSQSFPDFIYDGVSIVAGGGPDTIYIDANGDNNVTVVPGSGADQIYLGQATGSMDEITSPVAIVNGAADDVLFLQDDQVGFADIYTIDNSSVTRSNFAGVSYPNVGSVRLATGDGADTFNVINTNNSPLTIDGQGGNDFLNLNTAFSGSAEVIFDQNQDFADVQSEPGGNLKLVGLAGLYLSTNFSNFEGNVTMDRGFIVERNNAGVSGGLSYWRDRIARGATTGATPFLRSEFANASALGDAIGYAYAQNLPFTQLGGFALQTGDLVMRYTLKGDTNLDLTVNFNDLLALAQNYNGTLKEWSNGDFDLNRNVDFNDLLSLAQNYNATAIPTLRADKRAQATSRATAGLLA